MKKATAIKILLILFDLIIVTFSYGIALWFRFDGRISLIPEHYVHGWMVATKMALVDAEVSFTPQASRME